MTACIYWEYVPYRSSIALFFHSGNDRYWKCQVDITSDGLIPATRGPIPLSPAVCSTPRVYTHLLQAVLSRYTQRVRIPTRLQKVYVQQATLVIRIKPLLTLFTKTAVLHHILLHLQEYTIIKCIPLTLKLKRMFYQNRQSLFTDRFFDPMPTISLFQQYTTMPLQTFLDEIRDNVNVTEQTIVSLSNDVDLYDEIVQWSTTDTSRRAKL